MTLISEKGILKQDQSWTLLLWEFFSKFNETFLNWKKSFRIGQTTNNMTFQKKWWKWNIESFYASILYISVFWNLSMGEWDCRFDSNFNIAVFELNLFVNKFNSNNGKNVLMINWQILVDLDINVKKFLSLGDVIGWTDSRQINL